jgi:hypothetical protein
MKNRLWFALPVVAALLTIPFPALAHHGAAGYDMDTPVIMKVTILEFEWGNPHGQIHFDVTDDKGNVVHWISECGPPVPMTEAGWTRKTLKPGDMVTLELRVAKNGSPRAILRKAILANGQELMNRG